MDVGDWLRKLGLERYDPAFRENRIDGEILPKLTAEDLKELGVEAVGDRRRLLAGIAALATANATAPSPRPAAAPASDAERRLLTVMFTDLVGSTALSARLDPEDLREIIGAYLRCCAQVIAQFGGFVAKYMGDSVLAYFGYPTANEDDAERAVTAGLALVETLASRPAPGAIPLPVRIGIATGMVVVGELIGSGEAQERGVVGETPNLAARLQALAEPGQVVIAPSTRRLTGGHFEYQELGPRPLKGFAEPVSPWVVLGVSAVASRFEARHESTLTPLVGREEEFDLLLRRWRQASEGEGRAVQLIGEPGIGKSRLTTALQERLRPEPHVELRYFCSPHHTDSAFFPFICQLERAARFERGEGPAEKLAKLDAMAALSDVDAEVVPLLAELLSLPMEGRTFPEMTPQQRKDKTLAALLALLEGLARKQPVLAIFEDVHWIDPTSLELLAQSVERAPQRRVMLLITARPEFAAPWPGHSHVTTLALTRLSRGEGATLVAGVAGGKALPEEVMAQILARTDGVPLFVEELTKTVLESGLLREAAGAYVLDAPLPEMAIPITLHASLMARLDRLPSAKEVAQIGAAIGRDFSYELLGAVAQIARENLAVALDHLVRAELVFCRGPPPHTVYTFKHALVRDAAYASLLRAPRQQLHARIAAALEARFPEITEAQPELLAQHCGEGGFEEKALKYWTLAGERAAERGANTEAIRHFRRALELIDRKSASRECAEAELRVLARLGPAVTTVEGWAAPELVTIYGRVRQLAGELRRPADAASAMVGLWLYHYTRSDVAAADAQSRELFAVAEAAGDPGLLLQAHHSAWPTCAQRGDFAGARRHVEEGLKLYDERAHSHHAFIYLGHDPAVCAYSLGGVTSCMQGYMRRALQEADRSIELARRLGHGPSIAHALRWMAYQHLIRDDVEAARLTSAELLRLCREHRIGTPVLAAGVIQGWATARSGQLEEGLCQLRPLLKEIRRSPERFFASHHIALVAEVCAAAGHRDEAFSLYEEAIAAAHASGDVWLLSNTFCRYGEALLDGPRDARENSELQLQSAIELARRQQIRLEELRATGALAQLWAERGERRRAQALLAPIYGWFTDGFDVPVIARAKQLLESLG